MGKRSRAIRPKKAKKAVTGRLIGHPDGYGFVIPDDVTLGGDVFIPPKKMGNAVDGDTVRVRLSATPQGGRKKRGGGPEGEIVKVLSRARETVVGRVFHHERYSYVAPLDLRYRYSVRLLDEEAKKVAEGKIVVVTILAQPGEREPPLGEIREVLGDPNDPEIQYKIVCYSHGIPLDFPDAVLREAAALEVPDGEETANRTDFRNLPTVTIDGETARDFDDAISIQKLEKGFFRLWVHIADVSHYVPIGSRLDTEALLRGTSVYFPDRAIPMLPEKLSNQVCSLNPEVDRLTVSVVMDVNRKGDVEVAQFCRSIICSHHRMTYKAVKRILVDDDPALKGRYPEMLESLQWMRQLCTILSSKRRNRGAIDFDLPEPEIEYDVEGEVVDIVRSERNEAHRIIEEFMLLANETVAGHLENNGVPLLYRVHEEPDPAKVEDFLEIAGRFGYSMQPDQKEGYSSRAFQKLTQRLSGKTEQRFLSYLMLRSFKQAKYSEVNQGHFGLAAPCYGHFTSPIRRYPDLVVHRILKMAIDGRSQGQEAQQLYGQLQEMAERSSQREFKAVAAEREILRWIMSRFMGERLGEEYEAFVTGVKRNGLFVELVDHFVEGFVPVETLQDDFYVLNQRHHCLVGERTKKTYRVGQQLNVRVDRVNPYRHLVEFSALIPERRSGRKQRR